MTYISNRKRLNPKKQQKPNNHKINRDSWGADKAQAGWYNCIYYQNGQCISEYEFWSQNSNENAIKAYPSIVAGWNFGSGYKFGYGAGGLPFAVSSNKSVMTTWSVEHVNWDPDWEAYDVAFDIWLDDNDNLPENATPQMEFMIFLTETNNPPSGDVIASANNIWGTYWDVYKGPGGTSAPLYSFLRKSTTWSINNVNINDMFLWMEQNQPGVLPKYVIGIQAGEEINQGTGYMNNTKYSLSIS